MSNALTAMVVMKDMTNYLSSVSSSGIKKSDCRLALHFDYRCARKRDAKGHTYEASEPFMLSFSVQVTGTEQAKPFYQLLTSDENSPLSFLFDATFPNESLSSYGSAMVVNGYMVDVQEDFSSQDQTQMILHARMIVHSITYIKESDTKTFTVD